MLSLSRSTSGKANVYPLHSSLTAFGTMYIIQAHQSAPHQLTNTAKRQSTTTENTTTKADETQQLKELKMVSAKLARSRREHLPLYFKKKTFQT